MVRPMPASSQHQLPLTSDTDALAQLCKAAADPLRLDILAVLKAESFGVLELCSILNIAQSKLSHHLKILANAGLVATRRDGNSIFYRRPLLDTQDPASPVKQALLAQLDNMSSPVWDKQINAIKAARSASSLEFFAKNADKFRENQDLIAENSQYVANIVELIEQCNFPASATAIEIGPGEGDFLGELAPRFQQVHAIDNSAAMLERAQHNPALQSYDNIHWLLGDQSSAVAAQLQSQLVVCNMVLHHTPSPAQTFSDMARLLKTGGYLLISELCHHDQDWVRDACGDLWLGFEAEELHQWAADAGLVTQHNLFLGLRNGFQIQLHLYQKSNT